MPAFHNDVTSECHNSIQPPESVWYLGVLSALPSQTRPYIDAHGIVHCPMGKDYLGTITNCLAYFSFC